MLPAVETDEEWDEVVPDEDVMRPGVRDLCARLGVPARELTRFAEGSQPVYAVGDDLVLKLFPGQAARDGLAEGRVLAHVHGRLPVPTPRVHDAGEYVNGWRYVLMSRLPGEELVSRWPQLGRPERERLVTQAGEALAALHALGTAPLADVLGPGDWGVFTREQRAGAVEQQRRHGLPAGWLEQIPDFLAGVELPLDPRPVLLHTEFMRQHLLVTPDAAPRLSGLFDFEPAMVGDAAYDMVAVGLFVTGGDPLLMRRFADAYGRSFDPRVVMAYTLLHVYSNLPRYLRELPAPPRPTLDALAEVWFGTGTGAEEGAR